MIDLRSSVVLLALMVAACGDPQPANKTNATGAADDNRVECALHGAADFRRECTVTRAADNDELILTITAPDGGFRRLRVTKDGRGVIAADGAVPAAVTILGDDRIEVRIADDRYRLPATVK